MLLSAWRYKRFHVSFVLAGLCFGVLFGLLAGRLIHIVFWWPIAVIAIALIIASLRSRRWYACLIIIIAGMMLGVLRGSLFAEQLRALDRYVGQQITVEGTIMQDPVLKNGSNVWEAEIGNIRVNDARHAGGMYVTIVSDDIVKRGDTVTFSGKALEGFGSFQVVMHRASLQHITRPNDVFLAVRDSFAEAVRKVMPEPEASLGLGFVVGQKSALPSDLVEQLKIVGLTHMVVASGYNLTILVRFARRLLAKRSRYLAFAGSMLLVVGFVFVSGFSASMNRAAAVTILSLLAWYYGRKFHPVKLILYVAAVSAFMHPLYVWGDLGWLLSFAAFTGILVIAPIITQSLTKKGREPNAIFQLVTETLSAEIMTLPILIVSFGYIPIFALLANVIVAPVIPFAMLLTFIAGLVGWLMPALTLLALPATILIAYVIAIIEWLASPEWARIPVAMSSTLVLLWYSLIAFIGWRIWRRRKIDLLASGVVE